MNKAERDTFLLSKGININSVNEFEMSELQALKIREGIVAQIWHGVRKPLIWIEPFFKIKRSAHLMLKAFISMMDEFYGTGKENNND